VVPEEKHVYTDHDGYQREHVKHDGCLCSHHFSSTSHTTTMHLPVMGPRNRLPEVAAS
jgi:hypothetical protein